MRALAFAVFAACAAPRALPADAPDELPADATRTYTLWLAGARVGTATESEQWSPLGVHVHRGESLHFRRGDADVDVATAIDIDADLRLRPTRVRWSERSGRVEERALLSRAAAGDAWQSSAAQQPPPHDAIPAELVALYVRRDGHFAGRVFEPARGFRAVDERVDRVSPGHFVATPARSEIELGADDMPARVVDGDGVIALRADPLAARAPFVPVDLVAATSLAIAGTRTAHATLALDGAARADAPPAGAPGPDRSGEIRALIADVRARITPDLAAPAPRDASDAATATAGDCTTFALAYAALAAAHDIPTRVVTGFRVDADRLVRHRWATSWTGRAWVAVDASFDADALAGESAQRALVALAVHDADAAGLVAGDAALARVRGAAWR